MYVRRQRITVIRAVVTALWETRTLPGSPGSAGTSSDSWLCPGPAVGGGGASALRLWVCFPRFIHSARFQEEDYFPRYTYTFLMPFSFLVHNFNHCIPNPPEPGYLYFVSGVSGRIIKHPDLSSLKPQTFYYLFMFLCIRSLGRAQCRWLLSALWCLWPQLEWLKSWELAGPLSYSITWSDSSGVWESKMGSLPISEHLGSPPGGLITQ